jgi:KaiC domain protein
MSDEGDGGSEDDPAGDDGSGGDDQPQPGSDENGFSDATGDGPDESPGGDGTPEENDWAVGDGDPFGGGEDPFGDGESEDPFAGGGPGGSPGDASGGDPFSDDFEAAFEAGMSGPDFDQEYSSDIDRIDTGVEGLDEMIQGGIPERSLMVVIGAAGTGKTTFGLQFLNEGLEQGETSIFITLEESREDILAAAAERDWGFREHVENDRLAIVDLDPIEMANSLSSLRGDLPELIADYGASRLVLDSVSLLEMMYDDQGERRTEIYDFTRALKEAGVTTMLTSEANEDNPYASRRGIIEYLTDAVFILQYVRSEFRETRLAVEIQKIRDANHSRETKPYEITGEGISVYQQANIF